MKWLIKNPAPADERQHKWGDFHFGQSLGLALEHLGHQVETDYHPRWNNDKQSDVVLVLRGKHAYSRAGVNRDAHHILWNISHPSTVTIDECSQYDRIFVASEERAREFESNLPGRVHALLQCTDTNRFAPGEDTGEATRRDIVFVGNTRSHRRELVLAAAEAALPLRLWGRGWRDFGLAPRVVDDYIENEDLGALYRSARVCLNDHWPDMVEAGFINNRIFDALACGLPVITDVHSAVAELFPPPAVRQTTPQGFGEAIGEMLLRYPLHLEAAAECAARVRAEHGFDARARELEYHLT